jgi:hypothetical protein
MTKDEQIAREYRFRYADSGGRAWWDRLNDEDTPRIDQNEDLDYSNLFQ